MLLLWIFFVIQVFEFEFVIPKLHQAATKGGTRMMFGQEMKVKPQPAKTVVKAFPASQLKSQIWGHAERLMLVAPWGFGAQLVFQRLSLMYTKSPWVLVEIYHHCSFGHSERSDLRDKRTAENCATESVKLQQASHRGFDKKMNQHILVWE